MKTKRVAWFHEDKYRLIELLPASWWDYCAVQMGMMDAYAKAESAGVEWYEAFGDEPLAPSGIRVADLASAIRTHMPSFATVTTGYSTHVEPCPNAVAFGPSTRVILFASWSEDNPDVVSKVWLHLMPCNEKERAAAVAAFRSLRRWDLILADWELNRLYSLSDDPALESHIKDRVVSRRRPTSLLP